MLPPDVFWNRVLSTPVEPGPGNFLDDRRRQLLGHYRALSPQEILARATRNVDIVEQLAASQQESRRGKPGATPPPSPVATRLLGKLSALINYPKGSHTARAHATELPLLGNIPHDPALPIDKKRKDRGGAPPLSALLSQAPKRADEIVRLGDKRRKYMRAIVREQVELKQAGKVELLTLEQWRSGPPWVLVPCSGVMTGDHMVVSRHRR